MDDVTHTGIPWLTDPQRDFLAHLLTLCIQRQLKPERMSASPNPSRTSPETG